MANEQIPNGREACAHNTPRGFEHLPDGAVCPGYPGIPPVGAPKPDGPAGACDAGGCPNWLGYAILRCSPQHQSPRLQTSRCIIHRNTCVDKTRFINDLDNELCCPVLAKAATFVVPRGSKRATKCANHSWQQQTASFSTTYEYFSTPSAYPQTSMQFVLL